MINIEVMETRAVFNITILKNNEKWMNIYCNDKFEDHSSMKNEYWWFDRIKITVPHRKVMKLSNGVRSNI